MHNKEKPIAASKQIKSKAQTILPQRRVLPIWDMRPHWFNKKDSLYSKYNLEMETNHAVQSK
jgi:hypothetical protein